MPHPERACDPFLGGVDGQTILSMINYTNDPLTMEGFDCDGNELSNDTIIPAEFTIGQVYPNPFNPSTTIDWGMKYGSTHRLEIYNTSGQLVDILSQGYINAGYHSVSWNGQNQSSGIYIVRLIADGMFVSSRKIMLVK